MGSNFPGGDPPWKVLSPEGTPVKQSALARTPAKLIATEGPLGRQAG